MTPGQTRQGASSVAETGTQPKGIVLLKPRGFCAGVVRAIDIVNIALECYGKPIYVRKEIVHNTQVVAELSRKGAVFVESLEEVPEGARVIFSAHGVSPQVRQEVADRNLKVIDATCPLVTKVHLEAVRFAQLECLVVQFAVAQNFHLQARTVLRLNYRDFPQGCLGGPGGHRTGTRHAGSRSGTRNRGGTRSSLNSDLQAVGNRRGPDVRLLPKRDFHAQVRLAVRAVVGKHPVAGYQRGLNGLAVRVAVPGNARDVQ